MGELILENVAKNFGGLKAVDRLDMTLKKGEILGLIGPNGAGKTTVFNLITGVYTPNNGKITYRNKKTQPPSTSRNRGNRHCPNISKHPPVQGHDGA